MSNPRPTSTHTPSTRGPLARSRWAAIGAAVAVTLGAAGLGGYNIVNAEVTSGERTVLVTVDPCRLADTRPGGENVGPRSVPLRAEETHTFDAQQSGVPCAGEISAAATSLLLNVTAVDATASTFVTFWSSGTRPKVSSLNPTPGEPPAPNAVTVGLSNSNTFEAYNNAGSVDVIIDVVGYYEGHNHDDRYYTKSQSNDRFTPSSATCTAPDFFPVNSDDGYAGSAGVRGTVGSESLVCGLDIPAGAVIESFTSYIYDNSAAVDGRCNLGAHNLQTREALIIADGAATIGQSTLPQNVPTTLLPTIIAEGSKLYVECTSPDALVAISAVTVEFRLLG